MHGNCCFLRSRSIIVGLAKVYVLIISSFIFAVSARKSAFLAMQFQVFNQRPIYIYIYMYIYIYIEREREREIDRERDKAVEQNTNNYQM